MTSSSTPPVDKTTIHELDYFQIFGLDADSCVANGSKLDAFAVGMVKKVFRKRSLQFHPDKDPTPEARAAFERLKDAADTLTSESSCRDYLRTFRKAAEDREKTTRVTQAAQQAAVDLKRKEEEYRRQRAEEAAAKQRLFQTRGEGGEGSRLEQAEAVAALRRSMMSSWRQLELDMVSDWDVGAEELAAKEREITRLVAKFGGKAAPGTRAAEHAKRLREQVLAPTLQPTASQPAR
jgi:hypothetical protein